MFESACFLTLLQLCCIRILSQSLSLPQQLTLATLNFMFNGAPSVLSAADLGNQYNPRFSSNFATFESFAHVLVCSLLCSRNLEVSPFAPVYSSQFVLSMVRQASTRPFSILSTFTTIMMSSITFSGNCVGMSSLRRQDNTFLRSSNKPWLPFSHELPSPCELLTHTCVATPVQCLHNHEYVVHLRAERPVESRCRRFFCRRQFQLVPLVQGSEI